MALKIIFQTIEIAAYDFESNAVLAEFGGIVAYNEHHGEIFHFNGLVYRKRDGSNGIRFLIRAEDQSFSLIQLPGIHMGVGGWCVGEDVQVYLINNHETCGMCGLCDTKEVSYPDLSQMCVEGKMIWCREESLSSLLSIEMVDLPVSDIQAQMQDEFGSQKGDS